MIPRCARVLISQTQRFFSPPLVFGFFSPSTETGTTEYGTFSLSRIPFVYVLTAYEIECLLLQLNAGPA